MLELSAARRPLISPLEVVPDETGLPIDRLDTLEAGFDTWGKRLDPGRRLVLMRRVHAGFTTAFRTQQTQSSPAQAAH